MGQCAKNLMNLIAALTGKKVLLGIERLFHFRTFRAEAPEPGPFSEILGKRMVAGRVDVSPQLPPVLDGISPDSAQHSKKSLLPDLVDLEMGQHARAQLYQQQRAKIRYKMSHSRFIISGQLFNVFVAQRLEQQPTSIRNPKLIPRYQAVFPQDFQHPRDVNCLHAAALMPFARPGHQHRIINRFFGGLLHCLK